MPEKCFLESGSSQRQERPLRVLIERDEIGVMLP